MTEETINSLGKYITTEILKQPSKIIGPDEPLISSGLIDSFHLVDLALFVEDTFGTHIADSELNAQSFDSLNQLAALIQSRRS